MRPPWSLSGPLADHRFRLLWTGQSLSWVGDAIMPVALTLAIIKATGSASDLGLVLAAAVVPRLVLILVGGVWADRLPRHKVMLVADLVNMGAQLAIGMEIISGALNIGHLMALSALSGAAAAFFTPASGGLVPATVEPPQVPKANALMGVSQQTASVLGPAIATGIVYTAGAGWAMIGNAATFAVSVCTLAFLKVPHTAATTREGFWTELRSGWQEMRRHRWYWTNIASHACWNMGRATYQTLARVSLPIGNLTLPAVIGDLACGG